jgi:hypothetical protein
MWSKTFWKSAVERMLRAGLAAVVSVMFADGVIDVLSVDWKAVGSVFLGAALMSLIMAILSTATTGTPGITETPNAQVVVKTTPQDGPIASDASALQNGTHVQVQAVNGY